MNLKKRFLKKLLKKKNLNRLTVLLLIVVVGALLRFLGTDWGLPSTSLHPDEILITGPAYTNAVNHSFEVKDYFRPNHVLIKANTLIFLTVNTIFFSLKDHSSLEMNYNEHITLFIAISRMFIALLGTITIVIAYKISEKLIPKSGLLTAALFAVFPPFVEHSHYITPDIALTLFIMLSILFLLNYLEKPTLPMLTLAGLSGAFAFCEKYPGGYICVLIATVIILTHIKNPFTVLKRGLFAIAVFIGGVFLISPVLLLDWRNVFEVLKGQNHIEHLGGDGLSTAGNLLYYIKMFAGHSGIILTLFVLFGIFAAFMLNKKQAVILILGIFFIVPLIFTNLHWDRWGLPVYGVLLILSSLGISYWFLIVPLKNRFIKYGLTAFLIALPWCGLAASSLSLLIGFFAPDSRIASVDYCIEHDINQVNTYYEANTTLEPGGFYGVFNSFDEQDPHRPKWEYRPYIMISSAQTDPFYAQPDRYGWIIKFYDAVKNTCEPVAVFEGITRRESMVEVDNIKNSIEEIIQYVNGGYRGYTISIYRA